MLNAIRKKMTVHIARTTIVAVAVAVLVVYSFNLFAKNIFFVSPLRERARARNHSVLCVSSFVDRFSHTLFPFVRSFCAHILCCRRCRRLAAACYSLVFIIFRLLYFISLLLVVRCSSVVSLRVVFSLANECHMIVCCCLCFARCAFFFVVVFFISIFFASSLLRRCSLVARVCRSLARSYISFHTKTVS